MGRGTLPAGLIEDAGGVGRKSRLQKRLFQIVDEVRAGELADAIELLGTSAGEVNGARIERQTLHVEEMVRQHPVHGGRAQVRMRRIVARKLRLMAHDVHRDAALAAEPDEISDAFHQLGLGDALAIEQRLALLPFDFAIGQQPDPIADAALGQGAVDVDQAPFARNRGEQLVVGDDGVVEVDAADGGPTYFRMHSMYLCSGTASTESRLPTTATAMAPTQLPMKPRMSMGVLRAAHSAVTASTASPAPTRSTTRPVKAGISQKPSSRLKHRQPCSPRVITIRSQDMRSEISWTISRRSPRGRRASSRISRSETEMKLAREYFETVLYP